MPIYHFKSSDEDVIKVSEGATPALAWADFETTDDIRGAAQKAIACKEYPMSAGVYEPYVLVYLETDAGLTPYAKLRV